MNNLNLKSLAYYILGGTLLCSAIAFLFREQSFDFLPNEKNIVVKSYNDSLDGGNSNASVVVKNNVATLTYTLGNKYEFPYVGMSFEPIKKNQSFDLSTYEEVRIKVKSQKSNIVRLSIKTLCDTVAGHRKPHNPMNYEYDLDYLPAQSDYVISVDKFKTPTWWYQDNNLENGNNLNCSLEKVISFDIESDEFVKRGEKDIIEVSELYAVKYNFWYLYILASGVLATVVILVLNYTQRKKTVFVHYQATPEIANSNDVLETKVFDYIANNYINPELSLSVINSETGIAENKISGIIKNRYNQSFKQYINNIRMTEAKRLLKESDATISEIAYTVGYNNVTHFNRVFKAETGISPGDYRRDQQS